MLKSLVNLREAYNSIVQSIYLEIRKTVKKKDMPNQLTELNDADWALLTEIVLTLEPIENAVTAIQREDITLTEVKKKIDVCYERVAELGKIS